MNNLRRASRALALSAVFIASASSLFAARREGVMPRESFGALLATKAADRAVLRKVPLQGKSLDVQLQRFDVWAPDAKIIERGAKGDRQLPVPALKTFKGHVDGYADSVAFLSVDGSEVSGLIMIGDRKYVILPAPAARRAAGREFEVLEQDDNDVPLESAAWACDVENYGPITDKGARSPIPYASEQKIAPQATTDATAMYQLRLALEADYEMTQKLGSTSSVSSYITNLIGASTAIYERDVRTRLVIGSAFVYSNSSDPWTKTSSLDALGELGTYYHNNRTGTSRSAAVLLSGKSMGGGVAWVGTICDGDFPATLNGTSVYGGHYGVIGSLSGSVSTSSSQPGFWDLLGFSHELGHVVGSQHTHCTASSGYGRSFVDQCRSGEGSGCYSGTQSVPAEKGTIMSYCHLLSGGYGNVRLIFGQAAEASEAILPVITNTIDPVTPNGNMTVDGSSSTSLSFAAGSAHSASLPSGAASYSWSISNGTISGSSTSRSVNFTVGSSGTTVITGTAANSNGCGVVNSRSITITGTPPNAGDDAYSTAMNTQLSVAAPGVLSDDTIASGTLAATLVSGTSNGSLTLNANGSFTYTPNASFLGNDSFTYSITDGVTSDTATATISVVDAMPSITAISPNSTDPGVGASITISGVNFKSGVAVRFNGATISSSRSSSTTLTATVPAPSSAGKLYSVEVCNTDGGCHLVSEKFSSHFNDALQSHMFVTRINTIFRNGITAGCGTGVYCPESSVTRAQMAVFLLRAKEGRSYAPPPATGTTFSDVPATSFYAPFIEELARRGITSGCGGTLYCPESPVTREQMSVFLLRTFEGSSYAPPAADGIFTDVSLSSFFAPWIEELAARGITSGCGGTNYCPSNAVTRGQMAVFLVTTFGLQ